MNVEKTHKYFKENGIIALRADKGIVKTSKQIDQLLVDLGNPTRAIPFYALYPAGGGDPVVVDGLITSDQVIRIFDEMKSGSAPDAEKVAREMNSRETNGPGESSAGKVVSAAPAF